MSTDPSPEVNVEARGLPAIPTDEQIELFAAGLVRARRLNWSGFRDDGTVPDRQSYTIPVVNQSVGDLVRAALAAQAEARREDAEMLLDWLEKHGKQITHRAYDGEWCVDSGGPFNEYGASLSEAIRAAMNTTHKGADHAE